MVNSKRLVQLVKKWQKIAAMMRRRISFLRNVAAEKSSVVNECYFVLYTNDNMRFTVPLEYLKRSVFLELLTMSEEELRLSSDGPITLPCESTFLNYVTSLVKGCMPEKLEKALPTSSSLASGQSHQQTLIYGY